MSTLNHDLSNSNINISACTDITGYGLLGHLNEMTHNNNLTANINFSNIPFLENVRKFASSGVIPGGTKKNHEFYKKNITFDKSLENYEQLMIADAQTSGGLLLSVSSKESNNLIQLLNEKSKYKSIEIGFFSIKKGNNIIISNE